MAQQISLATRLAKLWLLVNGMPDHTGFAKSLSQDHWEDIIQEGKMNFVNRIAVNPHSAPGIWAYLVGTIDLASACEKFAGYYRTTLSNTWRDMGRLAARRASRELLATRMLPAKWIDESYAERLREMVEAIGNVPLSEGEQKLKDALLEGLSTKEIAERLGITPDTCRKRKERLLDKLREALANVRESI